MELELLDMCWEGHVVWWRRCCCNCAPRLFRVQGSGKRHPKLDLDSYRLWGSASAERSRPEVEYHKQDCPVCLEFRSSTVLQSFVCSLLTLAALWKKLQRMTKDLARLCCVCALRSSLLCPLTQSTKCHPWKTSWLKYNWTWCSNFFESFQRLLL